MNAIYEILLTFSNKTGFLSSKRIERFVIFACMLAITIFYLVKGVYNWDISAGDLTMIIATWLGYAGFNTTQIRKDKTPPPPEDTQTP